MNLLPAFTHTDVKNIQLLPPKYYFFLKPWFFKEILHQGHCILQEEQVASFVFRDGNCSQCGWQPGGGNCQHVAALALLCLQEHEETLHTLADLFVDNPWEIVGKYLYDQISMRRAIAIRLDPHANGVSFCGSSDNGLNLEIALSSRAADELTASFPDISKVFSACRSDDSAGRTRLMDDLVHRTATKSEKNLAAAGLTSKKQNFESSVWHFLGQLLFLHFPADNIQIKQDETGVYTLYYTEKCSTVFSLSLSRNHTWELLNKLSLPDIPAQVEHAEQFSHVAFCPDSSDIKVSHCCRLGNGAEYKLSDIRKYSYGSRYQINDTLFTLQSVPVDEQLHQTQKKQLSLFSVLKNNTTDSRYGFVVEEKKVAVF